MPNEVFLSHSHRDRPFVLQLSEVLRNQGVPFWYSEVHILAAHMWHDQIGAALGRCDWFILVLSPDAVESQWVKRELLFCLMQQRFEGHIVPLLHRPCSPDELSWTLPQIHTVDFTRSFDDGCRELLRIWGIGYAA